MNSIKILFSLLLLQCASLAIAFNGRCPPSWALYNRSCYKLFHTQTKFSSASAACDDVGAHLVSISNEKENQFVAGLCRYDSFYIGLNDISEEATFRWTDGTQFDFSDWLPNQPDNDQECVIFIKNSGRKGWADTACYFRMKYMCEKEAETESSINEATIRCPHSFETIIELGTPSKVVTWTEQFSWRRDSAFTITRSQSPGDRFLPGVTWVNYVISNVHSPDMVTCNFSITVLEIDTTRPKVVRCPDAITAIKKRNLPLAVKWLPPIAIDLTNITTTSSHSPGDKFKAGVTNVVYKFTDEGGNSAHCSFKIYVIEGNNHSGPPAIRRDMGTSNRLVVGLYVIFCFLCLILVLHLVVNIVRRRRRSFNFGKQSFTRINGDAKVEIMQP